MQVAVASFNCALSTGTQDITATALGSTVPKAVLLCIGGSDIFDDNDTHAKKSFGAADGTRQWAHGGNAGDGQGTTQTATGTATNRCALVMTDAGATPTIEGDASFDSFIAGGVRINWQTAVNDDYKGIAIFFAGDDVSVRVDNVVFAAQDVETDITAPGFRPKLIFGSTTGQGSDTADDNLRLSIGAAVDNGAGYDQRSWIYQDYDNVATTRVRGQISNTRIGGRGDNTYQAEVTSPDANGFSLYARNGSPSSDYFFYLALTFDNEVDLFGYTEPGATGNNAVTGIGFQPNAVVMGNCSQTVENTDQEQSMEHGFSAFDGSIETTLSINSENGAGTSDANSNSFDEAYAAMDPTGTSTVSRATFVSFDSDGFTLNHSLVSGTNRKSWGVAFGPVPSTTESFMMVT